MGHHRCGMGGSRRGAGTHRFEHDRDALRACSPRHNRASKAERTHRVGSSRGARRGDTRTRLLFSPEDQRRSGPSAKLELPPLEAV
eukprot:4452218-Prymnesium_polylepis.1